MSKAARDPFDSLHARLDRVEQMLVELVERGRKNRRAAGKRAATIAAERRAEVVHQPTDLDRARARRILRRIGP